MKPWFVAIPWMLIIPTMGGIRWYELRRTSGNWWVYCESTYAPDANSRFMPSIAMNGQGDMALGYSVASSSVYPSIRYTGRKVSDPLNTMAIPEGEIVKGYYSQTGIDRWGDYSCMSVDPSDDTHFGIPMNMLAIQDG
ncbi:MAG: hypothetical protein R2764_10670 [Bacteroidales bacterium]